MLIVNKVLVLTATAALLLGAPAALGQQILAAPKTPVKTSTLAVPTSYAWMSPDVAAAWGAGYKGQGTTITVIDDFSSSSTFGGNWTGLRQVMRHGEWTRLETSLIAPSARIVSKDFNTSNTAVSLSSGLNILNLSYGMYAKAGYSIGSIGWGREESSIISYATSGKAIISKAAGNDAIAIGSKNAAGNVDYLDVALIGTQSTIFVGALDKNGTTASKANLASYSNSAGSNTAVQNHFLVVGVEGSKTGLYGTSFAAPIVSGYAAVLGSKFTTATPTQITNRLLDTARTDTLAGYTAAKFGKGEASLSRALAPVSIR